MKFTPLTDEEIGIVNLLPEGIYDYQVIQSEEKIGQSSGNSYISLLLKIFTNDGKEHLVFTNLSLIKLLKHFCDVNNMQDIYHSGNITDSQCINKNGGQVVIGIEKEKPNKNGGMYPAKNIVKDYIHKPKQSSLTPLVSKEDFVSDEIPF